MNTGSLDQVCQHPLLMLHLLNTQNSVMCVCFSPLVLQGLPLIAAEGADECARIHIQAYSGQLA